MTCGVRESKLKRAYAGVDEREVDERQEHLPGKLHVWKMTGRMKMMMMMDTLDFLVSMFLMLKQRIQLMRLKVR
jgi:hypothetical protein